MPLPTLYLKKSLILQTINQQDYMMEIAKNCLQKKKGGDGAAQKCIHAIKHDAAHIIVSQCEV